MNKNYYNKSREDATSMQNEASKYTTIPSIIVTLAGGYIYDIFGRQVTLFILISFSGFILVFYPIVSPS